MVEKLQTQLILLQDFHLVNASEKEKKYISNVIGIIDYLLKYIVIPSSYIESIGLDIGDFIMTLEAINNKKQDIDSIETPYVQIHERFTKIMKEHETDLFIRLATSRMKYENEIDILLETNKKAAEIAEAGKQEIENLINLAKGKIAEIGVREYEQVFGDESIEFSKSATRWFWGLVIALTALIAAAIFIPGVSHETTAGGIAEAIFRKVVAISGLFYVVSLCARNYRASKHNALVNKHRQNALKTFQIFIKSVQDDDPQTKNAVLLKATETIFGNQPSGFLPDSGDGDMSPKIIEIFKNIPTSAAGK